MATADSCPSVDDLLAFAAGTLDLAVMDSVAGHVVRCATCDAVLARASLMGVGTLPDGGRASDATPPLPSAIGFADRYHLGDRLGAGGMGHVYLAEQVLPIRRTVAVKVLKPGLDSHEFLARFDTERQAVARMDHPNIARLYDAGLTDNGRPYFAMELLAGDNIVSHADAHGLTIRHRVALFLPVCRAVQHAHQKGVIHRDLKPTNVLVTVVDGVAVPKVIDFGIAKAFSDDAPPDAATRPGLVVGTPEYMSPEQAAGSLSADIDTRSDIYSLGVVLYELLTGTTPFTLKTGGGSVWDLLRTIRDVDAPRPSTQVTAPAAAVRGGDLSRLRKQLSGDLEWVLGTALARDRDQRYATANAFAADLERFLGNEPVTAGPPSRRYRLRKFVARNRTGVAATLFAAVALLAGGMAATIGLIGSLESERTAREAERTALIALDRESLARAAAVESDRVARDLLAQTEAAETQARAEQELARDAERRAVDSKERALAADAKTRTALYSATDLVIEDFLKQRRKLTADEAGFLKRLRELYAQIAVAPGGDPLAYFEGARRLGSIHEALGAVTDAEAVFARIVTVLHPISVNRPTDRELQLCLARAHQRLAVVRRRTGNFAGAEEANKASAAVCKGLADRDAHDLEALAELARAHGNLANLYAEASPSAARAEVESQAALRTFAALAARDPKYRRDHGVAHFNLAQLYITRGEYPAAVRELRAALAIRAPLAEANEHEKFDGDLARVWSSLGVTLQAMGDLLDGEAALQTAVEIRRKLADDEPGVSAFQSDFARSLMNLAMIRGQLGRYSQVEPTLARAISTLERPARAGPADPAVRLTLGFAHALLSDNLRRVGETSLALGAANRGLALIGKPDPQLLSDYQSRQTRSSLLSERALALAALGRHSEAAAGWNDVLQLVPPPQRTLTVARLAECAARGGDRDEAAAILKHLSKAPFHSHGVYYRMAVASAALAQKSDDAHADRSVALLRAAVEGGLNDRDDIDREADFRNVAERDDFKTLLAKLPRREPAPLPRRAE